MQKIPNNTKYTFKEYKDTAFNLRKRDKIFEVYSIIIIGYYILMPYVFYITIFQPPVDLLNIFFVTISFMLIPLPWLVKFKKQLTEEITQMRKERN